MGRQDLDSDVNLTWQVEGSSFDPNEADWRLSLEGQPSRLDSLVVEELSLEAGWDGRVLDVSNLTSRFNAGSAQINGRVNLDPKRSDVYSDLRATWYVGDLHVIERLLRRDRLASRAGTVDLQVFGPAGEFLELHARERAHHPLPMRPQLTGLRDHLIVDAVGRLVLP